MSQSVFPIVTVGHVDHGKSTIVGHLLAQLGSLPEGKLEQIRLRCDQQNRPFEYAFILDSLREEQRQGITIDIARVFFNSQRRSYQLLDAPGHVEFIKNMVTGAAQAEGALLVVDAGQGLQENSRRHAYLLSFLGVGQVAVLINKMDSVEFSQARFLELKNEFELFLATQNIQPKFIIPVSGLLGDNLITSSANMDWWQGPTVIEALDSFEKKQSTELEPFRMFVQDVYKFESAGTDRRVVVGKILSGRVHSGDELRQWPSRKTDRVLSLEGGISGDKPEYFSAGENASFVFSSALYVERGNLLSDVSSSSEFIVGKAWRADIFWLGRQSLRLNQSYLMRFGAFKTQVRIVKINRVIDTSSLGLDESGSEVRTNEAAEVVFVAEGEIAADLNAGRTELLRFVLVDNYSISGGGKLLSLENLELHEPGLMICEDLSLAAKTKVQRHILVIQIDKNQHRGKLVTSLIQFYKNLDMPLLVFSAEATDVSELEKVKLKVSGVFSIGVSCLILTSADLGNFGDALKKVFGESSVSTVSQVPRNSADLHCPVVDLEISNPTAALSDITNFLDKKYRAPRD